MTLLPKSKDNIKTLSVAQLRGHFTLCFILQNIKSEVSEAGGVPGRIVWYELKMSC